MHKKVLFVILDGIADDSEQTPLKLATKPNLDMLARNGFSGLIENREGNHPDSAISNFLLIGYDKADYPGRGYLDAMGLGLRPSPGSVYVRANFATVKEVEHDELKTGTFQPHLVVMDRRAGRDSTGLFEMAKTIKESYLDGVRVDFYKSLGHRGVIVMNSIAISPNVTDTDTEKEGMDVPEVRPISNDNEAAKTAAALNKFEKETYEILKKHPANKYREIPANFILLRGASTYRYLKSFKENTGMKGACVAASPVIKGIARAADMDVYDVSGTTGDLKTDVKAKALKAMEVLSSHDFVILHILGFDVAAHDKKPNLKRMFIEKVDREVFGKLLEYVNFETTLLVVASDHVTSSKTGEHKPGFLPFIFYSKGIESNRIQKFDEETCKQGPVIDIEFFMEEVMKYA
ncbi:MAG: 2,3-bisphosphoglycerate-independent phosphoglycerate mutase [Candidatus Aenigmatarchaeota archaeon]